MKTVHMTMVLDYYDGVQVFEGSDDAGGCYVGSAVQPEGGCERYLVTAAAPERIRQFRRGELDLRSLLLEAPDGEWFLALVKGDPGKNMKLEPQAGRMADTDFLPLDGYTLEYDPVYDAESIVAMDAPLDEKFRRLTMEWKEATAGLSSPRAVADHPAYRQIINLGAPALPLVLRDLMENGGWWHQALRALTGVNPVPDRDKDNLTLIEAAWIRWGRANGCIENG